MKSLPIRKPASCIPATPHVASPNMGAHTSALTAPKASDSASGTPLNAIAAVMTGTPISAAHAASLRIALRWRKAMMGRLQAPPPRMRRPGSRRPCSPRLPVLGARRPPGPGSRTQEELGRSLARHGPHAFSAVADVGRERWPGSAVPQQSPRDTGAEPEYDRQNEQPRRRGSLVLAAGEDGALPQRHQGERVGEDRQSTAADVATA